MDSNEFRNQIKKDAQKAQQEFDKLRGKLLGVYAEAVSTGKNYAELSELMDLMSEELRGILESLGRVDVDKFRDPLTGSRNILHLQSSMERIGRFIEMSFMVFRDTNLRISIEYGRPERA